MRKNNWQGAPDVDDDGDPGAAVNRSERSLVSVQRFDRATGERVWCRAKHKTTTRYQDQIAVACGGFIVMPGGIEHGRDVTCPDCLAGRDWRDET